MHTYLIQVTGQSKAAWEKHYTTTTWTAYNGTDRDAARKVAKEVAHGVCPDRTSHPGRHRVRRDLEPGQWMAEHGTSERSP